VIKFSIGATAVASTLLLSGCNVSSGTDAVGVDVNISKTDVGCAVGYDLALYLFPEGDGTLNYTVQDIDNAIKTESQTYTYSGKSISKDGVNYYIDECFIWDLDRNLSSPRYVNGNVDFLKIDRNCKVLNEYPTMPIGDNNFTDILEIDCSWQYSGSEFQSSSKEYLAKDISMIYGVFTHSETRKDSYFIQSWNIAERVLLPTISYTGSSSLTMSVGEIKEISFSIQNWSENVNWQTSSTGIAIPSEPTCDENGNCLTTLTAVSTGADKVTLKIENSEEELSFTITVN
jgi:hypothetical protein